MVLSDFYPTPRELVANEVGVLGRLMDDPYIAAEHPQFARDARAFHDRYRNLRDGFQFFSYFDVYHSEVPRRVKAIRGREQPNLRLLIASLIERRTATSYGNISYCLIVSRLRSGSSSVLRKFHFDITASRNVRRQEHPISHLQYCGGTIPLMGDLGPSQSQLEQMHMRLSEPRILFWPMSLALLIDLALHEFPDARSAKFRLTPEWRGIVRNNEVLILQRFFQRCVEVIRDNAHHNRTISDEFYVA